MKNLFIIRSPLQLINAMEAIFHFQLFNENNILYIIETKGLINTQQINNTLNNTTWAEIIWIKSTKKSNFMNYINMINTIKVNQYNYLFLGDYGNIHKIIISNIHVEHIFLLDDGTASIVIHNKLINNKFNLKDTLKLIRFIPFGLSIKQSKSINFFTIFDLTTTNTIGITKNEMKNLQSNYAIDSFTNSKNVSFLGQPFIESKILSKKIYLQHLNNVIEENFKNQPIEYFPHRGENIDNIAKNLINKFTNAHIVHNDIPLEKYFLENKIYPTVIVSVTSTALFTLKALFPKAKIYYIQIAQEDIFLKGQHSMDSIYKTLNNSNIIKLN